MQNLEEQLHWISETKKNRQIFRKKLTKTTKTKLGWKNVKKRNYIKEVAI